MNHFYLSHVLELFDHHQQASNPNFGRLILQQTLVSQILYCLMPINSEKKETLLPKSHGKKYATIS
jgi:hypothetical protein